MQFLAHSYDEMWLLLKPFCEKWYQLGIKFGLERRNLRSLIPHGYGLPADPLQCLDLMLKMRLNKDKLSWEEVIMVLARLLAEPYGCAFVFVFLHGTPDF